MTLIVCFSLIYQGRFLLPCRPQQSRSSTLFTVHTYQEHFNPKRFQSPVSNL